MRLRNCVGLFLGRLIQRLGAAMFPLVMHTAIKHPRPFLPGFEIFERVVFGEEVTADTDFLDQLNACQIRFEVHPAHHPFHHGGDFIIDDQLVLNSSRKTF